MSPKTFLFACLLLLAAPVAVAAEYEQSPGSTLTFSGSYQGEDFLGRFPGFATRLSFDPATPGKGWLEVVIPLTSASTGIGDYDGELRGPTFFDSATFAQARYSARGFRSLGGNRYAADGKLSLRGIEKPVTLEFTWTPGAAPVLEGSATVQRLDFGVGGGDWADTALLPNAIRIATKVVLQPAK